MTFPCTRCGLCCQNISGIEHLKAFDTGNGICVHFSERIGCLIYDQRPVCCRIDEGYEVFAGHLVNKSEYLAKNAEICNNLQQAAGMNSIYKVKL